MKKLIFGLMAFMLLFFVVSCDNGSKGFGAGTENNHYEKLEKTLKVELNSIDEVEFSEGEWEYYYSDYYCYDGTESEKVEYEAKITVKENSVTCVTDGYCKITLEFLYEDDYIDAKEDYSEEKDFSYNDKKKIITYSEYMPDEVIINYDDFINTFSGFFQENSSIITEDYCKTETYLAKTNSKKDAFLFYAERKYEASYIEELYYKYIFKKIK